MKVKKKRSKTFAVSADDLGKEYVACSEEEKTAKQRKAAITNRIKKLAADVGEHEGARCLIRGDVFTVGFTQLGAQQEVNWAGFAKLHPKLFAKLLSPQVDERKVEKALQTGLLPRTLLRKFLRPKRDGALRIFCERTKHEEED